ncbi:uncharacterized protein BDW70DRAFT_163861 [Aspergillus foveolatus]|uniref:uncharacterized protein n=1 Tax=Aspergillus foveolatus TaxID=210207 RepID=UPI003CCCAA36
MTLIPSDVPTLKDQALWSNSANTTLFNYGGRGANSTSTDNGAWAYSISDASWQSRRLCAPYSIRHCQLIQVLPPRQMILRRPQRGGVGGICGAANVAGLIWLFIWRRQKARNGTPEQAPGKPEALIKLQSPGELSAEGAARELDAYYSQRSELQAVTQMLHDLDSTTVNSRRYLR